MLSQSFSSLLVFLTAIVGEVEVGEAEYMSTKQIYEGCHVYKSCIAGILVTGSDYDEAGMLLLKPETEREADQNCVEHQSCQVMLILGQGRGGLDPKKNEVLVEIYGKTARYWIAVGFSHDLHMGDDFVVSCVWEGGADNNVNVHTSMNGKGTNAGNSKERTKKFARLIYANRTADYMWCVLGLKTNVDLLPPAVVSSPSALEKMPFYLLFAEGGQQLHVERNTSLVKHIRKYMFKNATDINEKFAPSGSQQRMLYAHAHFMILAWMFFIPVSLFVGRFYKETFLTIAPKYKKIMLGRPFWLFVHIVSSMIGLVFLLLGYALLTLGKSDWDYVGGMRPTDHLYSGIAAASIFTTTAYTAIFLEERDPSMSFHYAEFIHGGMGHASIFFAFWSLVSAHKIYYSRASCGIPYIATIWFLAYVGFNGFMSFHFLWVDWVRMKNGWFRSFFGFLDSLFRPFDQAKTEDAPGSKLRKKVLYLFIGSMGSLTFLMSFVYLLPGNACYSAKDYINFVYAPKHKHE